MIHAEPVGCVMSSMVLLPHIEGTVEGTSQKGQYVHSKNTQLFKN